MLDNKEEVLSWLSAVEQNHGVSPIIGDRSTCETGDEYVEVVCSRSGKTIFDGVASREKTSALAWEAWVRAFISYQGPRGGKIYWRHRPEITQVKASDWENATHEEVGFTVYSRVFVADRT